MTDMPAQELPIREILQTAGRAPSVHNTQPWFWCVDGDRLTLFADHARQLPRTDPDARDLLLSCGAALHHLSIAAAGAGWAADIRRMPNQTNQAQLADIAFGRRPATPQARRAVDAMMRRRTDRRRMSSWPVPRSRMAPLIEAAGQCGASAFAVMSAPARYMLHSLQDAADAAQRRDPRYLEELEAWVERHDGQGIPFANLVRHPPLVGDRGAGTRFPSGTLADAYSSEEEPCDALIVICSPNDSVASRLRAGEALSAVLLRATADGLASTTLSQTVEVDRTREVLRDELLHATVVPQVLVQLGWPEDGVDPLPPTPRRPIDELLSDPVDLPARFEPYQPPRR